MKAQTKYRIDESEALTRRKEHGNKPAGMGD